MAMHTLPDAVLQAAVDAVKSHGTVSAAALAAGMPRSTLQKQVTAAGRRWPGCLPPALPGSHKPRAMGEGYTAPELPDADEDLDGLIARLAAAQRRERDTRRAAEWMRFDVEGDAPFCLAFIGDPHLDTCDLDTLRGHVDLVRATPRMWAVGLGDYLNQWAGRLRAKYADQAATERDAFRLARWLFQQPIWWLLLLGNHDGMRWHGQGTPLRWIEAAAPVPVQDWQAKFEVGCGGKSWRVWAAHDFPGTSMWNPLHAPAKRAQMTGAVADLFVCGDHHTYALGHTQHEHTGRDYWVARARGYKPLDDYALEKGYGEQTMGQSIGAVFDPRDGSLVCFSDLEKAAAYLAFLNRPRVRVPAGKAA